MCCITLRMCNIHCCSCLCVIISIDDSECFGMPADFFLLRGSDPSGWQSLQGSQRFICPVTRVNAPCLFVVFQSYTFGQHDCNCCTSCTHSLNARPWLCSTIKPAQDLDVITQQKQKAAPDFAAPSSQSEMWTSSCSRSTKLLESLQTTSPGCSCSQCKVGASR